MYGIIEHIYKQCALCGHYFDGQLDGSYRCPECQLKELPAAAPRSLTTLDSIGQPVSLAHVSRAA